jgi:hypothetical protein
MPGFFLVVGCFTDPFADAALNLRILEPFLNLAHALAPSRILCSDPFNHALAGSWIGHPELFHKVNGGERRRFDGRQKMGGTFQGRNAFCSG